MSDRRLYYSQEAETVVKQRMAIGAAVCLTLGMGIGIVMSMLWKQGGQTRDALADALEEGYRRGRDATESALRSLEQEIPNLRDRVNSMIGMGQEESSSEWDFNYGSDYGSSYRNY